MKSLTAIHPNLKRIRRVLREIGISDWQYMINSSDDKFTIYFPPDSTLSKSTKDKVYKMISEMA